MKPISAIIFGLLIKASVFGQISIRINEFTYLYFGSQLNDGNVQQRVIYAMKDSMASKMKVLIGEAINRHFQSGLDVQVLYMSVGGLNIGATDFPKFKPMLQQNNPGGLEFYLRILDYGGNTVLPSSSQNKSLATRLMFECKVLNSNDGAEVFSRKMEVNLNRTPVPRGAYPMMMVPGMPASFLSAMDSSFRVFFSNAAPGLLNQTVVTPCLYNNPEPGSSIRSVVKFETSQSGIKMVNGPEIAWVPGDLGVQRVGKPKKKGNGIGASVFTSATGLEITKEKTVTNSIMTHIFMADEGTRSNYGFHVPMKSVSSTTVTTYREEDNDGTKYVKKNQGPTSTSRTLREGGFITRKMDTIGTFTISNATAIAEINKPQYCWDGRDSSTIMMIPAKWSRQAQLATLSVTGILYGKPFKVTNAIAANLLDVWYDETHLATFKIYNEQPTDGIIFETDFPDEILKVFAMFSSLPFSYYGFQE